MNQWLTNGASCLVFPNPGQLVGNKVRFEWDDIRWATDSYLTSVASLVTGTREWGLFRESSGTVLKMLAAGNAAATISTNVAADFGATAFTGPGYFQQLANGNWTVNANGVTKTGTASLGTSRLSTAYFRLGGRAGSDTVGNYLSAYVMGSGDWFAGEVRLYINDVLVLRYRMPSTGTTLRNFVSGTVDGLVWGTGVFNTPKAAVGSGKTNYAFIGASITEHTLDYGQMSADMESKLAAKGIQAVVHQRAIGGDDSSDLVAKLPGHLSAFAGYEANTTFVVDIGGNDVSDFGPYPGGAATLDTNYQKIITDIKAAGFKVLPCSISYRVPPASNPAEPYNTGVIIPAIQALAPEAITNGRPYIDLHAVSLDNEGTWHEADGIHPSPTGEELTRQYFADRIAASIAPAEEPGVTFLQVDTLNNVNAAFSVSGTIAPVSGANRIMLVGVSWEGSDTAQGSMTVAWEGRGFTYLGRVEALRSGNSENVVELWWLEEARYPSSSATLQVDLGLSHNNDLTVIALQYAGVKQDSPFGTLATATAALNDSVASVSTSTSATGGHLIASFITSGDAGTISAGTGVTQRANVKNGTDFSFAAGDSTGGASAWSIAGGATRVGVIAVPITANTPPGGGQPPVRKRRWVTRRNALSMSRGMIR